MRRSYFLLVTAVFEAATGLALLLFPAATVELLLGPGEAGPGTAAFRAAGAVLLAVGVACWLARANPTGPAQRRLFVGMLVYDVAAAAGLAFVALALGHAGVLLWPAVAAHTALAVWGGVLLRTNRPLSTP